ncbi:MAG: DUF192 domain-containing protein [Candidatus Edwardsbacteria bacterium]|nr:DUF192 domain-containing protein [Candidatus Edwardsbacteria bacterium]
MPSHRFPMFVVALILFAACGPGCKRTEPALKPQAAAVADARPGRTRIMIGQAPLWVEIADDNETRTQGLMFRKTMPEDEGMLFVFEYPQPLSFWMKNTYLPLDIAFVSSDYRILNILSMKPLDEVLRYTSAGAALYAIETNQGWFEKHGVKAGDRIRFE